MKIFLFIICLGIFPLLISGQSQCETRFDPCVNSTENRNLTEPPVREGSDRILNSIRAFARVGTGLHDLLSVPVGSRLPLGEVLSEVVPDVLLYLTPVNLSYIGPYINVSSQFLDDLLYQFMQFNLSNAEQSITNLVSTLDQGIDIALDIFRISFNDPSIEIIVMQIESIRNLPGFRDNLTCILSNVIQDPNIEVILEHLERIVAVVDDIKYLAAPITQLFSDNIRFMEKFQQIRARLDFSFAFQLCVDSVLTNLACPRIEGLSDGICNRACTDTLSYCSALLFQSLEDFSDVLDAASLLVFEEVKSSEFEQKYNELIGLSVEIVNTSLLALADLDYISLLNYSITTCGTEIIISEILLALNITVPSDQVFMIFDSIPDNAFENLTDFSYFYESITQTVLPYQNIRNAIEFIILPNGFLLNSLFSLAIQYTLTFYPPMGCFDQNSTVFTSSPILIPFKTPNVVNCWNGTDIIHFSIFGFSIMDIDSYPYHIGFNPAASRTCSFSISNFQSARINTQIDLCDEFASVIFGSTRTAQFLASIVSRDSSVLSTCRSTILLLLDGANVTLPSTAPTSLPGCVSNECTNSTSIRPTITYQLNDGADYIVNTTRTVATIGTSLSEFIDNINDRDALRDFLESTLSPALTYLAGINETDLRPFYGEMFSLANDFFFHILVNFSSDPNETVPHLIRLLERGLSIGLNLTRVLLGNDPNISFIFDLIDGVVSTPGLKENVTCILIELFSDPDIGEILSQLENLNILTQLMSVTQPILQLFNDSQLFKDKFNEVIDALPTSNALSLCVDSYLANLFCTSNASYCQDNCVDTLNYCTAYLFHSLRDFSNVLDAVLLLAAGSVETPEFEEQFYQFRAMLLNTTEITLDVIERFDILSFVDRTLRDCNSLPLIGGILSTLPIPGLSSLNSSDVAELIDSSLGALLSNFTIPPTPSVLAILNQTIQISSLLDLTQILYTFPDGFLLNEVLSLSVYNIMRSRPPFGCGYPIGMQGPLSYTLYTNFLSYCWNGETLLGFSNIPDQFENGPPFHDYSLYTISYNPAARRTCSFSPSTIQNFAISTNTDLCTIFNWIDPQSRMILRNAVIYFGKFSYCRDFIGNFSTTPTSSTVVTTTAAPIIAPDVNFQLPNYFASTNINVTVICGGIGTNVQFEIFPLNQTGIEFTLMSPITATQQLILTFISSSPGNFSFICRGNNPAGNSISRTTIIVRSLEENIDAFIDIEPDEIVNEETAMNLLSITGSVTGSEEIQNNATVAQQLANAATVIVASLSNTNISTDTAGAILGLLGAVEDSPALGLTTTSPPSTDEQAETAVEVSPVTIMVSQAIDIVALNLACQIQPGNPPIIVASTKITIVAATVEKTAGMLEYTLPGLPGIQVNIPLESFNLNAKIQIGAAQRVSPARVQVPAGETVNLVGTAPLLISNIFNLNIKLDGGEVSILSDPITFALETTLIPANGEKVCTFLDEDIGQFVQGNVVTIPSARVDVSSCQTMHLTSFGVLVRARSIQLSPSDTLAISIVSYILLSISLFFLVVSIILFLISARSFFKVETNILYFNYALALILATSVFIFGIQSARNSYVGCTIVGFLLHYTWLSVFSWSSAISIFMIYVLYFGKLIKKKIWWLMMLIGWGLPLPIVIPTIAVGVDRNEYINIGDHCFLSYMNGIIWAFLGPFAVLIIASFVGAFISAIKIIFLIIQKEGDLQLDFEAMKKLNLTILVLLPVLSVPWIIGIVNTFLTSALTVTVVEWVTILLTAPVGILFFFLVALRNTQVQEVIFKRKTAPKFSSSSKPRPRDITRSDLPTIADLSVPATFKNPTFEPLTAALLTSDEDISSNENDALVKEYDIEDTLAVALAKLDQEVEKLEILNKKKTIDAPTSPQEVYTTLGKLTTNKD